MHTPLRMIYTSHCAVHAVTAITAITSQTHYRKPRITLAKQFNQYARQFTSSLDRSLVITGLQMKSCAQTMRNMRNQQIHNLHYEGYSFDHSLQNCSGVL